MENFVTIGSLQLSWLADCCPQKPQLLSDSQFVIFFPNKSHTGFTYILRSSLLASKDSHCSKTFVHN